MKNLMENSALVINGRGKKSKKLHEKCSLSTISLTRHVKNECISDTVDSAKSFKGKMIAANVESLEQRDNEFVNAIFRVACNMMFN